MCSRIESVPGGNESSPATESHGASSNAHTPSISKIKFRCIFERRAPAGLRSPVQECKPSPRTAAKQFTNPDPIFVAQALLPVLFSALLLFSLLMPSSPPPPQLAQSQPSLERGLGLKEAV